VTRQLDLFDEPAAAARSVDTSAILRKTTCRVDEAAAVLNCSRRQIQYFLLDGRLRGVCKNRFMDPQPRRRHVVVLVESLKTFLERSMS
jgi:hypothetical protein